MNSKIINAFLLILFFSADSYPQKIITLDTIGSGSWSWSEKEIFVPMMKAKLVYNVSTPTLTVFRPDSIPANGTAVIVCPGGAFHILSIDSEGYDVARWLAKRGITAFVLKYRLIHCLTDNPLQEMMSKKIGSAQFNEDIKPIVAMDLTDAKNAMKYIRNNAKEYQIDPKKIGIMGFSAGGTVTTNLAYNFETETRPDFIAPIYAYVGSFDHSAVPANAPPAFIVVASDDQFGFDTHAIQLYEEWRKSKLPAELHVYTKGGHGFGMQVQHLPSDSWIERFGDWLKQQGFMSK